MPGVEMPATFSLRKLFNWRYASLLAAMLGLVVLASGAQRFAARVFEPGHGARWIWAAGDYRDGDPIAFYAVRELELEAAAPARIAITADDTYLLYVNGRRVGAGSYRLDAPLDEYEIGDFLQTGVNRILVEVRSNRGAGGLIAEITLGSVGTPLAHDISVGAHHPIVTDGSWRIVRRYDPGLFGGWSTPESGEAPRVWGTAAHRSLAPGYRAPPVPGPAPGLSSSRAPPAAAAQAAP